MLEALKKFLNGIACLVAGIVGMGVTRLLPYNMPTEIVGISFLMAGLAGLAINWAWAAQLIKQEIFEFFYNREYRKARREWERLHRPQKRR